MNTNAIRSRSTTPRFFRPDVASMLVLRHMRCFCLFMASARKRSFLIGQRHFHNPNARKALV